MGIMGCHYKKRQQVTETLGASSGKSVFETIGEISAKLDQLDGSNQETQAKLVGLMEKIEIMSKELTDVTKKTSDLAVAVAV